MRWPWKRAREVAERRREPSGLDRILAVMERRALEEQEVEEREREILLNELHRRLVAEEIDDPVQRLKAEARVGAARSQGWVPNEHFLDS